MHKAPSELRSASGQPTLGMASIERIREFIHAVPRLCCRARLSEPSWMHACLAVLHSSSRRHIVKLLRKQALHVNRTIGRLREASEGHFPRPRAAALCRDALAHARKAKHKAHPLFVLSHSVLKAVLVPRIPQSAHRSTLRSACAEFTTSGTLIIATFCVVLRPRLERYQLDTDPALRAASIVTICIVSDSKHCGRCQSASADHTSSGPAAPDPCG